MGRGAPLVVFVGIGLEDKFDKPKAALLAVSLDTTDLHFPS
jgi:hypothetical protein